MIVYILYIFLTLQNVTKTDAGEYKVVAKNEFGEGNATITVNLDEPKYVSSKTTFVTE